MSLFFWFFSLYFFSSDQNFVVLWFRREFVFNEIQFRIETFFSLLRRFFKTMKKGSNFFQMMKNLWPASNGSNQKKNGRGQKCEKSKSGKIWPKVRSNFFSPIAVFLLHIVSQKAIVWSSTSRPKIGETFHWRQGFLERIKNSWFFSPIQIQTLEKNKRKSLPGVV